MFSWFLFFLNHPDFSLALISSTKKSFNVALTPKDFSALAEITSYWLS